MIKSVVLLRKFIVDLADRSNRGNRSVQNSFIYDSESGEIPLEINSMGLKSCGMVANAFEKMRYIMMSKTNGTSVLREIIRYLFCNGLNTLIWAKSNKRIAAITTPWQVRAC